jgi:CRP-like cAMP-binding protein
MSAILTHLAHLTPTGFPAGASLVTEGAPAGKLFVLVSGTLEVFRDEIPVASLNTPGAVVGEIAALLGRPASATVRAQNAVTAHVVADPDRFLAQNPALLLEVARTLAARLDATTAFLVQSRHRFDGEDDLDFIEAVFSLLGRQAPPQEAPPQQALPPRAASTNEVLES